MKTIAQIRHALAELKNDVMAACDPVNRASMLALDKLTEADGWLSRSTPRDREPPADPDEHTPVEPIRRSGEFPVQR